MEFNIAGLRALQPGEGDLWDPETPGLHCIANSDGSKSFMLHYRTRAGRRRKPKVGTFGEITLAEARKRAKALLDRVALGEDPKGDWDEQKAELTVRGLWQKAWDEYWDTERFRTSGWGRNVKQLYENQIDSPFGNAKLSEVTAFKVRAWHQGMADKPYLGNRALAVFSRMFRFAEEQELRNQHSNPCLLVKNHPEQKRKRFATQDEISRIAPLLEEEGKGNPHGVAYLYLLIFSGSRPVLIDRARWEHLKEFTLDGQPYGILTLPGKSTHKTGDDETVILPPQAMKALARLPRIEGDTITGIKMPRRLWRKIKRKAGCEDLWARDWRRTFATVGMSGGIGAGVIGELLNHHSTETTKTYAKLMDASRVEAATSIANRLEEMLKVVIEATSKGQTG